MARFGPGVADELPALLERLEATSAICAADEHVARLHAPPLPDPVLLPAGEAAKTVDAWLSCVRAFAERGLDRDGVVVAFGGGAALDAAGFAAAVHLRGVRWIAVPTTLLAQVDAAHGGKTGIDGGGAKNAIGAFHAPVEVLCDPRYLKTQSTRDSACGLAEVVKHAVIGAPALLDRAGREDPARFVEEAARVKLEIVARDPREAGERRVLNLGHTLGHALEAASDFALRHGEAVALGLRAACAMAEEHCGFRSRARVEEALSRCGLPERAPEGLDESRVLSGLRADKKRRGGRLRWVLPVALGDVRVFDDVPDSLVRTGIRAVWPGPRAPRAR